MYYENKKSFYIKQYGPVALVIVSALILISTAVIFGLKYINNNTIVAKQPHQDEKIIDTNAYSYTSEAITGSVKSIDGLTITVVSNDIAYDINLIGIMQNEKNPELSKTISVDLQGKTVTIDYDTSKTEDGKVYGYIYLNGNLYNETLLARGLAQLRPERQNINKLDILVAAQIKARHEGLGIWKY